MVSGIFDNSILIVSAEAILPVPSKQMLDKAANKNFAN
jgi:hypothetical protein